MILVWFTFILFSPFFLLSCTNHTNSFKSFNPSPQDKADRRLCLRNMTLLVPTLYLYIFACAAASPPLTRAVFFCTMQTKFYKHVHPRAFDLQLLLCITIGAVCTGSKWRRTSEVGITLLQQCIPFSDRRFMQLFLACCRLSFKLKLNLIKMNIKENQLFKMFTYKLTTLQKSCQCEKCSLYSNFFPM